MRASYEAYEKVAEHCSEFDSAASKNSYTNAYSDNQEVTCVNCRHFDADKYCKLDLYDPIAKKHHIDE